MKKKKKRARVRLRKGRILLVLILFIGIIYLAFTLVKDLFSEDKDLPIIKKEEKEEVYTLSMITAGDNLIHSSVYKDANRLAGYNGYDFKPMYEYIKELIKDYDLKYYNQETILGGSELGLSDYPTFNSPYEVGEAMIDAGFNLVSMATNHTMDSGEKAVINSRNYWNRQDNVLAVGSYSSKEERDKVEIREVNNITYALLNYTYGTNGIPVPSGKDYLVNVWPTDIDNINNPETDTKYQKYKETVKEDIQRVRDKVDVLMVAMHWGVEYTHEPTAYEKDMAKFLSDNGVDVIIGTHPHVVQPITWIDDTLVIYSLGNFISAQYQNQATCLNYKCMVGDMASFNITKTIKDGNTTIKIDNVNNELIYTYYTGWRYFKVVPFSNEHISEYLPNYKQIYTTYKDVIQKYDSSINVVDAYE